MKTLKKIFIVLFTVAIVNIGYSQVGVNYKQPYNGTAQTVLKKENHNSFELSATSHNYKQQNDEVHTTQQTNNFACCSGKPTNAFFSASNYKQPYSRNTENSCIQELVCNGKAALECCKN
jgi:hypothetical protein